MTRLTVLFLLAMSSGCAATQARPLTSLSLDTHELVAASTTRSVAVGPFTDARGAEFQRSRHVPLVGLLHHSSKFFYPDAAGVLRGRDDHGHFVTTGSLDDSLPEMLVETMQHMQLSNTVGLSTRMEGSDYFVDGSLKRSTLRRDTMPIAIAVGLLGVPFEVSHFDLAYEVDLYDARTPSEPIFQRTYEVGATRAKGLYYNHDAGAALLASGLRQTLPLVVRDVARAISLAEAKHAPM